MQIMNDVVHVMATLCTQVDDPVKMHHPGTWWVGPPTLSLLNFKFVIDFFPLYISTLVPFVQHAFNISCTLFYLKLKDLWEALSQQWQTEVKIGQDVQKQNMQLFCMTRTSGSPFHTHEDWKADPEVWSQHNNPCSIFRRLSFLSLVHPLSIMSSSSLMIFLLLFSSM